MRRRTSTWDRLLMMTSAGTAALTTTMGKMPRTQKPSLVTMLNSASTELPSRTTCTWRRISTKTGQRLYVLLGSEFKFRYLTVLIQLAEELSESERNLAHELHLSFVALCPELICRSLQTKIRMICEAVRPVREEFERDLVHQAGDVVFN